MKIPGSWPAATLCAMARDVLNCRHALRFAPVRQLRQHRGFMTPDDLIGTWTLLGNHHRSPEGAVLDAQFGPDPMGVIRFDANGRMIVVIADARVRLPDGLDRRPFSGYTGRWALNDDVLTTEVDESFLTQYVGSGAAARGCLSRRTPDARPAAACDRWRDSLSRTGLGKIPGA